MPVKLEHIHQPSEADWTDLSKIQQETSPDGLNKDQAALSQWLDNNHWVIAGRFNDRLIGALLAEKTSPDTVLLSAAGVRAVTQRRGVMHQMIHFIQRWADSEGLQLAIEPNCPEALQQALIRRGFESFEDKTLYNPQ